MTRATRIHRCGFCKRLYMGRRRTHARTCEAYQKHLAEKKQ